MLAMDVLCCENLEAVSISVYDSYMYIIVL